MAYCKLSEIDGTSASPVSITHTLTVNYDQTWSLHVHGQTLTPDFCHAIASYPSKLTPEQATSLLRRVDTLKVCMGNPDDRFLELLKAKKGSITGPDGSASAYLDDTPFKLNGVRYCSTVRSSKCQVIGHNVKCESCAKYRSNLRSMYNRWEKRSRKELDLSSHINDRYLITPEKRAKITKLRTKARISHQGVIYLREKIRKLTEQCRETVDDNLHNDLISVMRENREAVSKAYPEGTFRRLFWDEQFKAASLTDSRQMKWHSVIIKWCLNLNLISSAAYHAVSNSNFIKLPSERTLQDYTSYFENKGGFQAEVDQQLVDEVQRLNLPDKGKYFGLLIDEMKIKEGLVYNKHTGKIIGFTKLGDINYTLLKIEQGDDHPPVSKYLLALMVRGTLSSLKFPYAHFATMGVTADMLLPIVDEAINRLECRDLKVISVTADGASPNRKLFHLYSSQDVSVPYKTQNVYSHTGKRWLYFFIDPPHLIKTSRNCWANSGPNGTRHMQVKYISCTCMLVNGDS